MISEDSQGMTIDPEYVEAVENEIVHDDTPIEVYKIVGYLALYIIPSREPGRWESWDLNLGGGCDGDPVVGTYDEALGELFESVSILTGEGRGARGAVAHRLGLHSGQVNSHLKRHKERDTTPDEPHEHGDA